MSEPIASQKPAKFRRKYLQIQRQSLCTFRRAQVVTAWLVHINFFDQRYLRK